MHKEAALVTSSCEAVHFQAIGPSLAEFYAKKVAIGSEQETEAGSFLCAYRRYCNHMILLVIARAGEAVNLDNAGRCPRPLDAEQVIILGKRKVILHGVLGAYRRYCNHRILLVIA